MGGRAAIILVVGFGFIFGTIAFRVNELESRTIDNTSRYFEVTNSHNLAVSAVNVALSKMYQDTTLWSKTTDTILVSQSLTSGPFAGGGFTVLLDVNAVNPRNKNIVATSRYPSNGHTLRDTVIVALRELSLSEIFALHIGFKGNDDRWITKDSTWGRVHFNGRVFVTGSPVYVDRITVSKAFSPPVGTSFSHPIFLNGYETGVAEIPLANDAQAYQTFPYADTTLNGSWTFEFVDTSAINNNGYVAIRSGLRNFTDAPSCYYFYNLPGKNQVIKVTGEVSVMGKIDGRVTVASTDKIWIEGDLEYAVNPEVNQTSDDMLGLVAMEEIRIWAKQPTPPSTFHVQCVMISLKNTLTADYENNIHVLRTFGAVILQDRLDIAAYSSSASGPTPYIQKGFYKRFRWDPRLADPTVRPPYFPQPENLPRMLQIVNWWENVRIPEY